MRWAQHVRILFPMPHVFMNFDGTCGKIASAQEHTELYHTRIWMCIHVNGCSYGIIRTYVLLHF